MAGLRHTADNPVNLTTFFYPGPPAPWVTPYPILGLSGLSGLSEMPVNWGFFGCQPVRRGCHGCQAYRACKQT
jgi:hypothetical protein